MTSFKSHVTDFTNASRTMLFDIVNLVWDKKILNYFNIPDSILPKVQPSSSNFGIFNFVAEKYESITNPVFSLT